MVALRPTEVRPTGGLLTTVGSQCQVLKRSDTEHIDGLKVEQPARIENLEVACGIIMRRNEGQPSQGYIG